MHDQPSHHPDIVLRENKENPLRRSGIRGRRESSLYRRHMLAQQQHDAASHSQIVHRGGDAAHFPGCGAAVTLAGGKNTAQGFLMGRYERLPAVIQDGRPVYFSESRKQYLFYVQKTRHWVVGGDRHSDNGGIFKPGVADCPDQPDGGVWMVWEAHAWQSVPVSVRCSAGCPQGSRSQKRNRRGDSDQADKARAPTQRNYGGTKKVNQKGPRGYGKRPRKLTHAYAHDPNDHLSDHKFHDQGIDVDLLDDPIDDMRGRRQSKKTTTKSRRRRRRTTVEPDPDLTDYAIPHKLHFCRQYTDAGYGPPPHTHGRPHDHTPSLSPGIGSPTLLWQECR